MIRKNIDREWEFIKGIPESGFMSMFNKPETRIVNIPHDFQIESDVTPEAPGGRDTGYYSGGIGTYTKYLDIPSDYEGKRIMLEFDGAYMNTTVGINGQIIMRHNYGYTPFHADLTPYIRAGKKNRITVTVNNSMQPNSRWYTGAGLYRHVDLLVSDPIHISPWGIFAYNSHITDGNAFVYVETTVENHTARDVSVWVDTVISAEGKDSAKGRAKVYVPAGDKATARVLIPVMDARLWDIDDPFLYTVKSVISDGNGELDSHCVDFGIRTISVDTVNGFMLNGRSLKLKGGCIHHDNGILGAEAHFDCEYRKVKIHKENGYNALRTAHNPPSRDLLKACDMLGVLVLDEAFDCWYNSKNINDYGLFFENDWEKDMEAFILRDRNHPSVIMWSTGNEIIERNGISKGHLIAGMLAAKVRSLDPTRPVTNGVCSLWNGLEDEDMAKIMEEMRKSLAGEASAQNADSSLGDKMWGDYTEAFNSVLDVVGYNYLHHRYSKDGEQFPNRIICGTESWPNTFDNVWRETLRLPHVIGDFTWTSYDYIGEAAIGNSRFVDKSADTSAMRFVSNSSPYPWRLANCGDFDILGHPRPQLAFRKVVWGSEETYLFTQDPKYFDLTEVVSMWGFEDIHCSWTWAGAEGKPIRVTVFSEAEEVELFINGKSVGRKSAGEANRYRAVFETTYMPGSIEAVSYKDGKEISRTQLKTVGAPARVSLYPERMEIASGGESLCYVKVAVEDADGNHVPDAAIKLQAEVTGAAELAGFGSANPVTEENYTTGIFTTFNGLAQAVLRSGTAAGKAELKVSSELGESTVTIDVI